MTYKSVKTKELVLNTDLTIKCEIFTLFRLIVRQCDKTIDANNISIIVVSTKVNFLQHDWAGPSVFETVNLECCRLCHLTLKINQELFQNLTTK